MDSRWLLTLDPYYCTQSGIEASPEWALNRPIPATFLPSIRFFLGIEGLFDRIGHVGGDDRGGILREEEGRHRGGGARDRPKLGGLPRTCPAHPLRCQRASPISLQLPATGAPEQASVRQGTDTTDEPGGS